MAKLVNTSKSTELASRIEKADGFFARMKGLLGRSNLESGSTLWIPSCNSIHTICMKFTIDAVFVDREMKVKGTRSNLKPGRITLPIFSAESVFELPAGVIEKTGTAPGDQLYVVD